MWQWEKDTHILGYFHIALQFIAMVKNIDFLSLTYMC